MIEIAFFRAEVFFAVIWLLLRTVVWLRQKHIDGKREAILLFMYINLAVILRIAFFPMTCVDGRVQPLLFDAASVLPLRVNLIPFVNLLNYESSKDLLLNLIGNVSMFIPSGIILPILYKRLNNFGKVLAAGALISLGIEILQLPFSVRASDIDDLILNTAGVMIGYAIYTGFMHCRAKRTDARTDQ